MVAFWLLVLLAASQASALESPIHDENGPVPELYQVDDMLFTPEQYRQEVLGSIGGRSKRQWSYANTRPWSGNNNVVPYRFAAGFRKDWEPLVRKAAQEWERKTCLRFRPARPNDKNVIEFYHGNGCTSPVGMNRVNRISLKSPGCGSHKTILHEIGHSLGMGHEHQHPDQAKYMTIQNQNIEESWRKWYQPMARNRVNTHGFKYDPYSVMHYSAGNKSKPKILMKDPKLQMVVGRVTELSNGDAAFIRKTHGCQGGTGTGGKGTGGKGTGGSGSSTCKGANGRRSVNGGQKVRQVFTNKTGRPVRLFWVNTSGRTNAGWLIQPNRRRTINSNSSHVFVARIEGGAWVKIGGQCVRAASSGNVDIRV
ncbi:unnamed protein product [Owenia fusiformis]|uniref:Metalloendopeptidase n=1 Tax=Owenia fusiformis TaxID=6347 RepID=A0A8S4P6D4_OWEFU|nr:unnamed protein product [Owenia fusiformis]